ncbi:hypothetical protein B566_EDAN009481 [Ephemera danica]|nr:hypothetical protein B566_EDAN009481 [Ephemera danica]
MADAVMEEDTSATKSIIEHYQRSIENSLDNDSRLLHCLQKLYKLDIKVPHLQATGVGRTVNGLRKREGEVGVAARKLVGKWMEIVENHSTSSSEDETSDSKGYMNGDKTIDKMSSKPNKSHNKSQNCDDNFGESSKRSSSSNDNSKKHHESRSSKHKSDRSSDSSSHNGKSKSSSSSRRHSESPCKDSSKSKHKQRDESKEHKKSKDRDRSEESRERKHKSSKDKKSDKHKHKRDKDKRSKSDKPEKENSFEDAIIPKISKHSKPSKNVCVVEPVVKKICVVEPIIKQEPAPDDDFDDDDYSEQEEAPIDLPVPQYFRDKVPVIKSEPIDSDNSDVAGPSSRRCESPSGGSFEAALGLIDTTSPSKKEKKKSSKSPTKSSRTTIEEMGYVPFYIMEPVLSRASATQLANIEHFNPQITGDTGDLWRTLVQADFKGAQRLDEDEEWRDVYKRSISEREDKLSLLRDRIKKNNEARKAPQRTTKLAFEHTLAKPPRAVRKQQMKNGTSRGSLPAAPVRVVTPSQAGPSGMSSSAQSAQSSHASTIARTVGLLRDGPSMSITSRKRPAPLMQKTLKFMKTNFRR